MDLVLTPEQIHVPGMTSTDVKLSLYKEFSYLMNLVKYLSEDKLLLPGSRDWLLSGLLTYIERKGKKISLEKVLGLNKSPGRNPFDAAKSEHRVVTLREYKEFSNLLSVVDYLKKSPDSLPNVTNWQDIDDP